MAATALVIDDDRDVQLLSKLLLEQHGFAVETVGSLGELVRQPSLLEATLILLDLELGEFTGLDILDYLYDLRLNAAILLISASASENVTRAIDAGRAKGLQMLGFLPKSGFLTGLPAFLSPLEAKAGMPTAEDLTQALEGGELFLVYQPQQDLQRGAIKGVEALVRWQHPTLGLLFPDSFIPMAEKHGLIGALTWQVLELALAQQVRWQAKGWALNVAVNVPADFVKEEGVIESFKRLKSHYVTGPARLTLELTESVGIECLNYARHVLEALRDLGCRLSLDDFGTGYSSLRQLYRLPFDELKVDRSFVSLMEQDDAARAISLSVIDLGKRMGLEVVAEGIETQVQLDLLIEAGCSMGQGYYLARPQSAAAFEQWLGERRSHESAQPATTPSFSSTC
ncbi:EAL domain-containing response regulator [Halomonas sp. PAMB 3264]|uniref:EAL domain-containing response regulator n=1 Tax=Halomonas sp. PAMB 3264 TaxID=3075222 RepID=UPI0028987597|nr:EAL domain-containing response regulator [Halomonas sp. PAMB 3264]WNL41477.1 EAL domain-containing response regulator [Halomonas sp. PAMB 3264]